jgi:hypothetical protein
LGLGPPADEFLNDLTNRRLHSMCKALGVAPQGAGKAHHIAAIILVLLDGERLRSLVATAPAAMRRVLEQMASRGGVLVFEHAYGLPPSVQLDSELEWAIDRGLLFPTAPWSGEFVMPAEAALALRGPDYTAPFDPREPACPRAPVAPDIVTRDAAAAAGAFLRLADRVVDNASRTRIATIRSGGVGIRELRRLAKACDRDVSGVRLVLAALHGAGLVTTVFDGVTPTEECDAWLAREPADRLAALVQAWWSLPYSPLSTDGGWEPSEVDDGTQDLRTAALTLFAAEPGAPTGSLSFVESMRWRHPYLLRAELDRFTAIVAALRVEATALGALGAGAISDAGRALLAQDAAALTEALANVGRSVSTAHLQADLTATVAGSPSPKITDLLTAVADRESTGAASTWRFSPDSIRRGLDSGWTADRLLASLEEIAAAGVPQALTYLIRDVERRHGVIRGTEVVCCLRSDDAALLAELVVDRRLRALGLRPLAPTVLAGAKPLAETLAALRKAGYAPVQESDDGTAVVESTAPRRSAVAPAPRSVAKAEAERNAIAAARRRVLAGQLDEIEPLELARTLLGRPDGEYHPPQPIRGYLDDLDDIDPEIDDDDLPHHGQWRHPPYHPPYPRRRRRYY